MICCYVLDSQASQSVHSSTSLTDLYKCVYELYIFHSILYNCKCTLGVLLSVILEKVVCTPSMLPLVLLKIWWEESLSALIADNKLALYYGRGKKWSELWNNDFFGSRTLLVTHMNRSARSAFWMILNVLFDSHSFSYNLSGKFAADNRKLCESD